MTLSPRVRSYSWPILLTTLSVFVFHQIHSLRLLRFDDLIDIRSNFRPEDGAQSTFPETAIPRKYALAKTDPNDILVIMKTGATEIWEKMPLQINTILRQMPNVIYFSDMDEMIGNIHFMDALADCNETLKRTHPDFELYRHQQRLQKFGQRVEKNDPVVAGGWDLDKYKFPHQLQKTWALWPNAKWYVFIEADTYLSWNNLLHYLDGLDSLEPIYVGKKLFVDGVHYAHGGTGYILSNPAMRRTVGSDPTFAAKYEAQTPNVVFGDLLLGKAMEDYGIKFVDTHAMMRAEPAHLIRYSKSDLCLPVLSTHHMNAADIDAMWTLEQDKLATGEHLFFADIFDRFVMPFITDIREDWWNLVAHIKYPEAAAQVPNPGFDVVPSRSFETCRRICNRREQCTTYSWNSGKCYMHRKVQLGEYKLKESNGTTVTSGWKPRAIQSLRQSAEECLLEQNS